MGLADRPQFGSRWLPALLAVLFLLAAAACGSGGSGGGSSESSGGATADEGTGTEAESGEQWPDTVEGIALYDGDDRRAMLEAGAREEGTVVFYSSLATDFQEAIAQGFRASYPDIDFQFTRIDSGDIIPRVIQEHQAGRLQMDVINSSVLYPLVTEGILTRWHSPELEHVPEWGIGEDGQRAATTINNYGFTYNTGLVPEDKIPRNWDDLLDPFWQGKILTEGPYDPKFFVGIEHALGKERGAEYIERIAEYSVLQQGSTARVNAVIAGEQPGALGIYLYRPFQDIAEKNAPLGTVVLNPTIGSPTWVGINKNAPHPHAAMLFLDWLYSVEGMQILANDRIVVRQDIRYEQEHLQLLADQLANVERMLIDDAWYPEELPEMEDRLGRLHGVQ